MVTHHSHVSNHESFLESLSERPLAFTKSTDVGAAAQHQVFAAGNPNYVLFSLFFNRARIWVLQTLATEIVRDDKSVEISLDAIYNKLWVEVPE